MDTTSTSNHVCVCSNDSCLFTELPPELLFLILPHLNAMDLCRLSSTNRFFYHLSSKDVFWKSLYLETFPSFSWESSDNNSSSSSFDNSLLGTNNNNTSMVALLASSWCKSREGKAASGSSEGPNDFNFNFSKNNFQKRTASSKTLSPSASCPQSSPASSPPASPTLSRRIDLRSSTSSNKVTLYYWKNKFIKDSQPSWKPPRKMKDARRALEYFEVVGSTPQEKKNKEQPKEKKEKLKEKEKEKQKEKENIENNNSDNSMQCEMKKPLRVLPVVLLSAGAVGKSRVIERFIKKVFQHVYDPTIEDIYQKQLQVPGTDLNFIMQLMDTSGVEEYSAMREYYINKSDGFIIMYSITNRQSFDFAVKLIQLVKRIKGTNDPPIVLAGAKCDLDKQREVSLLEGKKLAQKYGYPFFEVSALQNKNIDDMFYDISMEIAMKNSASLGSTGKQKQKNPNRREEGGKRDKCSIM